MVNDGSATLDGINAAGVAEGIKQQKKAHRDAVLASIKSQQSQLAAALLVARAQIEAMEKDLAGDYLPRYGGHLFSTARQIAEICVRIDGLNAAC